jgi:radical S-adenosyl methionine domain-containing protein 2
MFHKKITLSGLAGSGKTTIGKLLAEKLGYEFNSVGDFSRRFAMEKFNVDINRFQEICKQTPAIDLELDSAFEKFGIENEHFVMDYRLGGIFIRDGYHIFLKVSDNVAALRINMNDRGSEFCNNSIQHKLQILNKRNVLMKQRFLQSYNYDFTNLENYHLVIDTDGYSPEIVVDTILPHLECD